MLGEPDRFFEAESEAMEACINLDVDARDPVVGLRGTAESIAERG